MSDKWLVDTFVLGIISSHPDKRWHEIDSPRWLNYRDFVVVAHELIRQGVVEKVHHPANINCEEWYGYKLKSNAK